MSKHRSVDSSLRLITLLALIALGLPVACGDDDGGESPNGMAGTGGHGPADGMTPPRGGTPGMHSDGIAMDGSGWVIGDGIAMDGGNFPCTVDCDAGSDMDAGDEDAG